MHIKLRVLFVSHAYVVGVNQGKLKAIADTNKAEVGLLAPSNWKGLEWNRPLPVERPYSNLHIYTAPVLFPGRGGAHLYSPLEIQRVLHEFQPDVVQVEEEVFSLSTCEIAAWTRLKKVPLAVFGWENLDRQLPLPRQWTQRFVLESAQLIIAGNQDGAHLLRQWGYKGLVEVMPQMGVDPTFFSPHLRQPQIGDLRIGFVGRLVPEKGVDVLLRAIAHLRDRGLTCRLVLCGSGSLESELRQLEQQLQIEGWVEWRGAVRHAAVPQELGRMDVLVLPSRSTPTWKEQFGHVLIEAMAMGIPVIGSTCGEIPHVIGRSDLVFPEGKSQDLAAILARMIQEPDWRTTAGADGMNKVQQHYTHEQIAERLLTLWQGLIDQQATAEISEAKCV